MPNPKDLMSDSRLPDPDPATAQNIMTRAEMRKTVVKVVFEPKRAKLPVVRPRRWEFATSVVAAEFIESICPPAGKQLGSPKQLRAKIARLLRLADPSIVTNYTITTELVVESIHPVPVSDINIEEDDDTVDTFDNSEPEAEVPDPLTDSTISIDADILDSEFPE